MPTVVVNYMAVVAATVATLVLGFIWYSKPVFGKTWMKLVGLKESDTKKDMMSAMAKMVVGALLVSYVLYHFLKYANAVGPVEGAIGGFWVWLGFALTSTVVMDAFEHRPMKLTLISAGWHLVELMVAGAVLAYFG